MTLGAQKVAPKKYQAGIFENVLYTILIKQSRYAENWRFSTCIIENLNATKIPLSNKNQKF